MNNLEFRAWDAARNEFNYKIMVGNTSDPDSDLYTAHCILIDGKWVNFDEHDDIVIEQFTGLKDSNGVKIFEGDIILQHLEWCGGYGSEESGEMEFNGVASITPSSGVVLNKCKSRDLIECDEEFKKHGSTINVRGYRCEVIGNIHENKDE